MEEELEAFLFLMGVSAVSISGVWSWHLIREAAVEPVKIAAAVLVCGFLFRAVRGKIKNAVNGLIKNLGIFGAVFCIVFFLGIISSAITAIIAALVLAEVISALKLEKDYELRVVVCACYAIGLGAALTPLGEPLSTIAIAKLKGAPHNADFFFLLRLLGLWVLPGIILLAWFAARRPGRHSADTMAEDRPEQNKTIAARAAKVYLFVMALVFLGAGLSPMAEMTVAKCPPWILYWVNIVSAALDNATLAAAEITPSMSAKMILFVLMGLLISGGMLIPGNIPNIISANKLNIRSRRWAKQAIPIGLALMVGYFILLISLT
ncbi:MAG: DUF1646 family protein [Elusimicrobia bacterium]|nr:DUF1646 family protein [Elusimicrobiota bacterium]